MRERSALAAAFRRTRIRGWRRAPCILHRVPFRVATFNAGLAVGVLPYSTERLPRVVEALAALEVDLLFVQEFWLDDHWQALRRATATKLPYAFRPPPSVPPRAAVCTTEQLAPLIACAKKHCAGLRDEPLARCVIAHCAEEGFSLPSDCLNCIASHPTGNLDEIVARCRGDDSTALVSSNDAPAAHAQPARSSGLIAYGGSFGTGLLSRTPLGSEDVLVFHATVNARGAMHARVDTEPFGRVDVFATHFSPLGSEQAAQVDELLAWIDQKAPRSPAVLLGDLNLNPESPLFRKIVGAGFREPDLIDRRATFGGGLGTGRVSTSGWRIDHVLLRQISGRVVSRRILDTPITLRSRSVRTTLSDHFGVMATFTRDPK